MTEKNSKRGSGGWNNTCSVDDEPKGRREDGTRIRRRDEEEGKGG
jgi:hypothetical protein